MFDIDKWQEIIATIRKNRLRTFLTACGVFWGMFMLLMMLGFGSGLETGVSQSMRGFATNSVYVWGQRTSMPYKGLQPGRRVSYTNEDTELILRNVDGIKHIAPRLQLGGWRDGNGVVYKDKVGNFGIAGDYPAIRHIQPMQMRKGRFLNQLDLADKRKVAVIGSQVKRILFGRHKNPIGEHIRIKGVYFTVVGLFDPMADGERGVRQASTVFLPFTTFQSAFNQGNRVGWFALTGEANVSGTQLERRVRKVLAKRHKIHPKDRQAIGSFNAEQKFGKIKRLFGGIKALIWFVGVVTLFAGVLGVSNIMLITVKERTKEIGIRKTLGGTPASIMTMIIQEAIVLTAIAGYAGVVISVGVLELFSKVLGSSNEMLRNPQVDFGVAVTAAAILVVAGALAGVMPARHAVKINPVEALRA